MKNNVGFFLLPTPSRKTEKGGGGRGGAKRHQYVREILKRTGKIIEVLERN